MARKLSPSANLLQISCASALVYRVGRPRGLVGLAAIAPTHAEHTLRVGLHEPDHQAVAKQERSDILRNDV